MFQSLIPSVGVLKEVTSILSLHFQILLYFHFIIFLYHYRHANLFLCNCLECCIYFNPRTCESFTSKCAPWWNLDCTRALHVKHAAWCSFRWKRNTPGHLSAFVSFKSSALFRKTINISKNISWCNYVSSITSNSPLSTIWKHIHKISGKHPPSSAPVLHIINEHVADPLLVATELVSFFCKISSRSHLPSQFTNIKLTVELNSITFLSSTVL